MNAPNDKINKPLLKEYFLYFHLCLLLVLLVNSICFYVENSIFYFKLFAFFLLCDLFITAVILKMPYDYLKPFVTPYLIATYIFVWYFVFCIWHYNPMVMIILILFPFGVYTIFSKKIVIIWCLAIVLSISITLITPKEIFSVRHNILNSNYENLKVITSIIIILGFIFYYNAKIIKSEFISEKIISPLPENGNDGDILNNEIYDDLYEQIINYFEKSEPWKHSDFSIQDLSDSLKSNSTYISRAINLKAKTNFKNFVNAYRIEFIKNEIQDNKNYSRYKLVYLYTKAGFKHQSTFNKVFRKFTDMTPSDYINSMNKE